MSEKLAWEVNRLDSLESGLYRIKDQISDKKILKKLGLDLKIISAENLRKKMVVTTGDNYVGTAEPELREKITALFGEVAAYAGRPSNAQLESLKDLNTQLKEVSAENQSLIEEIDNLIKNNVLKTHPNLQIAYLSMEDFLKLD